MKSIKATQVSMHPTPNYSLATLENTSMMDLGLFVTDDQLMAILQLEGQPTVAPFPPLPAPLPPQPPSRLSPAEMDLSSPDALKYPAKQRTWLSPELEEQSRQFWLGGDPGPSEPIAQTPTPDAVDLLAGPSSFNLDAEEMRPRKRRATRASVSSVRNRPEPPSSVVPSRTLANVYGGEGVAPTLFSPTLLGRDDRYAPHAAAMPSGSASSAAALYNYAHPPGLASATQGISGPHVASVEAPQWTGQFDPWAAYLGGSNASTVGGLQYPVSAPGFSTLPRPSTNEEVQCRSTPIPRWAAGDSNTGSPTGTEFDPTFGPYDPLEDANEALGLHVQEDNIILPPSQSLSRQPEVDRPIASSSRAKAQTAPSKTQPSKRPWATSEKVPFKDTVNGRLCTERGITEDTSGPFHCFLCKEKGRRRSTSYSTWGRFKHHLTRCQPKDKRLWPRCPFCKAAVGAIGRAWEMERHFAGKGKKKPCKVLKQLMEEGTNTNGAIGDWLRARSLPIETQYLGSRLAEAFYCAAYRGEGRDVPVNI